ncbi:MAG: nuclear transport factor 2 family protein [Pseudomonadales bacterium]|nr:nuclear transport factor 2 family protein [Pseudomonadales bacterium]NRA17915.1 nuclear transport factor 2 family protein [Oceanospirillaceae bacterium]
MPSNKKEQISNLLKSIETGDPAFISVVNEEKYIQHNPQTHEGSEGLAELFKRLSKTSPSVNIVRVFEDNDFVFAHTEYDFATRNIGFEIFRFEDGQAVEHWDNIQKRKAPNVSGNTMVDGETQVIDHDMTERNRRVIQSFIEDVLIVGCPGKLGDYINREEYREHNPHFANDLVDLSAALSNSTADGSIPIRYEKSHRLLAEGNFVLSVCEGYAHQVPSSFFDLYRLKDGKIVEHWDTTEAIPARDKWKNSNGKF